MRKDKTFDENQMIEMRQIILEKMKIAGAHRIGRSTLEGVKTSNWWDILAEELVINISSYMWAQRIVDDMYEFEYKIPATWWQHFKREKFPLSWKVRWPVKYRVEKEVVKFVRHATYPMASIIPEKNKDFFTERLGGVEVIKDHIERQNMQSGEDF